MGKIDGCSKALHQWNKTSFGNVGLEILKLEAFLRSTRDVEARREAFRKLREWRQKEEILWWQRARVDFLKFGDANTRWFHSRANGRRAHNRIAKLHDSNGDIQTDVDAVANVAVEYFCQLFTGATSLALDEVLDCVQPCVTDGINAQLCLPYSRVEIEQALSQMNPYKAPGPDGFNALFYQKHWDIIGDDVCAAVLSVLEGHASPSMVNHTFLALIPKKPSPTLITEFRPISLCNVVYKLVTKVLSNRLKPWLPAIISPNQSAFTPGRLITDNILIAYEVFHAMHRDYRVGGAMALKLDMAKAYDRVEWEFLRRVMLRMGFRRP